MDLYSEHVHVKRSFFVCWLELQYAMSNKKIRELLQHDKQLHGLITWQEGHRE